MKNSRNMFKISDKSLITDNLVPIIFILFTLFGFAVAKGVPFSFFLSDLSSRFYRNAFLVLSLIIPVIAGLGLNFGIVVGAMSAQIALVIVRYYYIEGLSGMLLCFLIATPIAALFGFLTGKLFNKTRGQEMIASLIVGFFAVGVIIPVPDTHPMIKTDGVGIRMSVDMGTLKYSLETVCEVPFMWAVLVTSAVLLAYYLIIRFAGKETPRDSSSNKKFIAKCAVLAFLIIFSIISIVTNNSLMTVKKVPVVTILLIAALCFFRAKSAYCPVQWNRC